MNNDYNRIISDSNADMRQSRSDSAHQAAMQQQTTQMIRAMRQMKEQEKVDMLKLEMAKTTDPQIQMQLQSLLDETLESIATRKRRELIVSIIMIVILAIGGFFLYQFIYSPSDVNNAAIQNNADPANILPVAAITETSTNKTVEESNTVDTMNLTDQQWVSDLRNEPAVNNYDAPETSEAVSENINEYSSISYPDDLYGASESYEESQEDRNSLIFSEPETIESTEKENTQSTYLGDPNYRDNIKIAYQNQLDYVNSMAEDKRESLQTPQSAAVAESNRLKMVFPDDAEIIQDSLDAVLNGD